jgi:DNA polymerase III sliding clamp (beta) subunit (PCNA family)
VDEMFKAKIKPQIIKQFSSILGAVTDEYKLKTNAAGIEAAGIDAGNNSMVFLEISSDAFNEFESTKHDLGINLKRMDSIVKLSSGEDIELQYDEVETKLIINIGSLRRTMRLVNIEDVKDIPMPQTKFPAKMSLPGPDEFMKGLRASEDVSDHMKLNLTKEQFMMVAEGDTDTVELTIPKDQLESLMTDKTHTSMYAIDLIKAVIALIPAKEKVAIEFGTNMPVKATFSIAEGKGTCILMVAPRVESV